MLGAALNLIVAPSLRDSVRMESVSAHTLSRVRLRSFNAATYVAVAKLSSAHARRSSVIRVASRISIRLATSSAMG